MIRRVLAVALACAASPAKAQESNASPPSAERSEAPPVLVAGLAAGYAARDDLPDSPFATASLTRYHGGSYLRGGITWYRSAIRQIDAALPSTYLVGSAGFGGTWHDWVLDLHASAGNQRFGQVTTLAGSRDSMAGRNAVYLALGARAGRRLALDGTTMLIGTVSLGYAATRSLRHALVRGGPVDLQLPERSLTGSAALRLDHGFGASGRFQLGLFAEHFVSNNGLTQLTFVDDAGGAGQSASPPGPGAGPGMGNTVRAVGVKTPDSWQEAGLSGTAALSRRVWLDGEVRRSNGAIAGNATTVSIGLRLIL